MDKVNKFERNFQKSLGFVGTHKTYRFSCESESVGLSVRSSQIFIKLPRSFRHVNVIIKTMYLIWHISIKVYKVEGEYVVSMKVFCRIFYLIHMRPVVVQFRNHLVPISREVSKIVPFVINFIFNIIRYLIMLFQTIKLSKKL